MVSWIAALFIILMQKQIKISIIISSVYSDQYTKLVAHGK